MTTILLARHGNTFDAGDTVIRLGNRIDLPLSSSGRAQAEMLGVYFKDNKIPIHAVFTSFLKRTIETASIALKVADITLSMRQNHMFDEIDYGPDEGKTEEEVIARIGKPTLVAWDANAQVPPGWLVDPQQIIKNWIDFAEMVTHKFPNRTVLVVTSNGIARFAPYLTNDFAGFSANNNIKLSTGALCSLNNDSGTWKIEYWNKNV